MRVNKWIIVVEEQSRLLCFYSQHNQIFVLCAEIGVDKCKKDFEFQCLILCKLLAWQYLFLCSLCQVLSNAHARRKDFEHTFQDEGVRKVSFEVISVDLDLFYTPEDVRACIQPTLHRDSVTDPLWGWGVCPDVSPSPNLLGVISLSIIV